MHKGFDMNEYCFSALLLLSAAWPVANQSRGSAFSLQPGPPIERVLSAGQSHAYTINLEKGQFVEVIVDQHGIDVVIRTFSASGQRLGEFDSPNGANGPENVGIAASVAGEYRLEVVPLDPSRNVQPGRYEIRIAEVRTATEEELKASRSQELLKAKGLALLQDVARSADQFRRPATRAALLMKAAQQLWDADETRARRLMEQAIDNVKQVVAAADVDDPNYFQIFQSAMQLRSQVIDVLVAHDPAMALDFLRSTRTLVNPEGPRGDAQYNRELQLELSIANRISPKDPVSAFRMAEDTLKQGVSRDIVNTLQQLRTKDPGLATRLSNDIASRLANESLLQHPEAANLATSFLQLNRTASLIPENEYRNLFQKMVNEALSYTMPFPNSYPMERNAAQNLLNAVKSMSRELQAYAPDQREAVEKKLLELNQNGPPFQLYQNSINNSTIDEALDVISRAPSDVRDGLYQQIASRVAQTGDMPRARQIITEHMSNVQQRQQGLRNLDRQVVYNAINQGKLDDALRTLIDFQPASERAQMLNQFLNRIGSGVKKATAITYLDQIRTMLGARRDEDQQQMMASFALARAFPRYDPNRAFAILEPLIDQFNDISAAAVVLDGFFQKYYEDREVILDNGNSVGALANELTTTLGNLAQTDFDRAKSLADAIHPTDIRLRVYLAIAEHAIQPRY